MFPPGHILWIAISAVLIVAGSAFCMTKRPAFEQVAKTCFCLGVVSEVVKIFSVAQILPVVDPVITSSAAGPVLSYVPTGRYIPYIENAHMPFELCSLQIFFYVIYFKAKDPVWKKRISALIFTTGIIGGILGILLAYIVAEYSSTYDLFTSVRAWQYFLYHSMVVVAGIYAGFGKDSTVSFKDIKGVILAIVSMDVVTFYVNSLLSDPVYERSKPIGLLYRSNFFSSYENPLGLVLTQKWQWIVYLAIRLVTALVIIFLLFLLQKKITGARKEL